jgi:hypothetical protein
MSHHYSGPDFGFPRGDARLDFTDLYAFPKPGNASKSILVDLSGVVAFLFVIEPSARLTDPGWTALCRVSRAVPQHSLRVCGSRVSIERA